jgi:transcriptional regulator with XRE-family HTH domain
MPIPSITKRPPAVQDARNAIRRKGWKQVDVARLLGVTPIHLSYVLNGRRESRRILTAISRLPSNPNPA